MVDAARQVVNQAEISESNDSSWDATTANQEQLIGGVLNVAITEYFQRCNSDEQILAGLTGGIPDNNAVSSGIATAYSSVGAADYQMAQFAISGSIGIDAADNNYCVRLSNE